MDPTVAYSWLFFPFMLFFIACCHLNARELSPDSELTIERLAKFSMKELMDVVVISSAKRAEPLAHASSAIYVITAEDIRRSGATHVADVLRMVPGLQVGRIDSNKWAISSRGFNNRFANKLLVLIDGRSVYTPTFSGVYWSAQDLFLEDVERVEVIRGPGATLWGANAVNGVINIITQKAKNTEGGIAIAGSGREEKGFGGFRYGAKLGENTNYRVYARYFDRDDSVDRHNNGTDDEWEKFHAGLRIDWEISDRNTLTIQGDVFNDNIEQRFISPSLNPFPAEIFEDDTDFTGGNLITRWDYIFSESSDMSLQIYYDRYKRENPLSEEKIGTIDVDFQNHFSIGWRQDLIWGLGYRFTSDHFKNSFLLSLNPDEREAHFYSAFLQDKITLIENRLHLVLGSKFEHNYYTGFEFQPNVRVLATPSDRQTIWGAISRAVRTPSRAENDARGNIEFQAPGTPENPNLPLPALIAPLGNRDLESENILAYEIGYRIQGTERFSLDLASFYNVYDDLVTLELDQNMVLRMPTHFVIPFVLDNKMDGETYGVEIVGNWTILERWRVIAAYSYLNMKLHIDSSSIDVASEEAEGESPQQQVSIRSSLDLTSTLEFDVWVRFVDDLPNLNIDGYIGLDIRLAWKPVPNLEFSLVGANLLDPHHPEFTPRFFNIQSTELQKSVYGKMVLNF